jgi:hypothetical protein
MFSSGYPLAARKWCIDPGFSIRGSWIPYLQRMICLHEHSRKHSREKKPAKIIIDFLIVVNVRISAS